VLGLIDATSNCGWAVAAIAVTAAARNMRRMMTPLFRRPGSAGQPQNTLGQPFLAPLPVRIMLQTVNFWIKILVWSKNSICLNPIMLRAERTIQGRAFRDRSNTTLHGPQLTCNVFLAAVRRVGTSSCFLVAL
jgi:hypothetical protein